MRIAGCPVGEFAAKANAKGLTCMRGGGGSGGVLAEAGARLAWTRVEPGVGLSNAPFAKWFVGGTLTRR